MNGSTALSAISDADVSALFPASVRVATTSSSPIPLPLSPSEMAAIASAVPARQNEFRLGRSCAKIALSQLGFNVHAIARDKDRVPVWPVGAVGSITHCEGFCGAAVVRTADVESIGLDAEIAGGNHAEIRPLTVSDDEIAAYPSGPTPHFDWDTAAFSAKEAFYKAYFPVTRTYLDFLDVEIRFAMNQPASGTFLIAMLNPQKPGRDVSSRMIGRWRAIGNLIICGAHLPRASAV